MACINCPQEGKTNIPQKIVGFKIWYADGSKKVITVQGRTNVQVLNDIKKLPTIGLQIIMIYYNRFSTDGTVRYRRIVQGNDLYYIVWDSTSPIEYQDWIIGQTNNQNDLVNYKNPVSMSATQVSDAFFKILNDQAMADNNITELGINPEPGTEDT